jgi:hypothetical protein
MPREGGPPRVDQNQQYDYVGQNIKRIDREASAPAYQLSQAKENLRHAHADDDRYEHA